MSGGYDGYIYKQESGNVWTRGTTTANLNAIYRSPDITMGDPGVRKNMQRVNLNWEPEGAVDANLYLRFLFIFSNFNGYKPPGVSDIILYNYNIYLFTIHI